MCVRQFQLHPHIKEWNNLNIACNEKGKSRNKGEYKNPYFFTDAHQSIRMMVGLIGQ